MYDLFIYLTGKNLRKLKVSKTVETSRKMQNYANNRKKIIAFYGDDPEFIFMFKTKFGEKNKW